VRSTAVWSSRSRRLLERSFSEKRPSLLSRAGPFFTNPLKQMIFAAAYQAQDGFYRRAKREGYRSRAAYKLLELNRRFHLIKPGDRVVDLGCAPGGWLQVASQLAGAKGRVIGIDIQPVEPVKEGNVFRIQGDLTSGDSQRRIEELLGSRADCVLSDLSPRLSGIRDRDLSRSLALVQLAFRIVARFLRRGGHFLVKTFEGEGTRDFYRELEQRFDSLQRARPEATRKGSSEIYLVARGFKADPNDLP